MVGQGLAVWPVYKSPPALSFTAEEEAVLKSWYLNSPELFKKIQKQSHLYRAILETHNKKAREHNKKILDALGYDSTTVEGLYKKED